MSLKESPHRYFTKLSREVTLNGCCNAKNNDRTLKIELRECEDEEEKEDLKKVRK